MGAALEPTHAMGPCGVRYHQAGDAPSVYRDGCAGGLYGGALDPTGHNAVTIAELRGVHMALADLPAGPVTLLLDSRAAIEHLRVWQAGRTEVMPDGAR